MFARHVVAAGRAVDKRVDTAQKEGVKIIFELLIEGYDYDLFDAREAAEAVLEEFGAERERSLDIPQPIALLEVTLGHLLLVPGAVVNL
jgi:hypothetical protein